MQLEADTLILEDPRSVSKPASKPVAKPTPKLVPGGRERRQWKRYKIDGAFASVRKPLLIKIRLGKGNWAKLGPIKDIGMKGLALQYVSDRDEGAQNHSCLSVVVPGEGAVDDIQYTVVNAFDVARLPNSDKSIRTLCVCFNRLLPFQRVRLEYFIEKYGVEVK